MRRTCCILATLAFGWLVGCANRSSQPAAQAAVLLPDKPVASARVLAFDPDLPGDRPMDLAIALDRDARQPAAYAGFDSQTISTYQVFQHDNQRIFSDRNGLEYQRSTYTWRMGTSYR